jgi:PAS domain S-box-containing protein
MLRLSADVFIRAFEAAWPISPVQRPGPYQKGDRHTMRDTTKKVKTFLDLSLKDSELRYRRLFETAQDGILILDAKTGIIEDVNPYLIKMLGYSRAEFIKKKLWEVGAFKDIEASQEAFEALQENEFIRYENLPLKTKDGRLIQVEFVSNVYQVGGEKVIQCNICDITLRKRAEDALRRNDILIRQGRDIILIMKLDNGRILEANEAALKAYGYTRDELLALTIGDLRAPATRGLMSDQMAQANGVGILFETVHQRKDGRTFPVEVSSQGATVEGVRELISVIRDITERKRAEQALRESEERFRCLSEASFEGIVFHDEGKILDANQAFATMLGYGLSEVIGRNALDFATPELREVALRHMRAESEKPYEGVAIRKDGSTFPVEVRGKNTPYKGRIIRLTALRDITERKQVEEALRESEERYRAIFEQAADSIMLIDAESGALAEFNDRAYESLGYTRQEFQKLKVADFEVVESAEEVVRHTEKIIREGADTFETKHRTTGGEIRDVLVSCRALSINKRGFIHGIRRDITERKQAEKALRESRERMAHLSRRLVEAQEEERRRIARELHDEVGQSLTALTISLESASRETTNSAMRDKIGGLQALTRSLITQVSALSTELRPRVLDDLGLIPGLIALFNRLSTQTGVEVDFKHTGLEKIRLAPEIEISAYRIVQEALTNVIRYAGVKTASVRLQVEGDILYIQVQDEGKGFDLQKALSAEDSLGLLSMTERAGQVGGSLEVETVSGEGTLITCRLPLGSKHIERRQHERGENRPGR